MSKISEIESLQLDTEDLRAAIAELRDALAERDYEIIGLEEEVDRLQNEDKPNLDKSIDDLIEAIAAASIGIPKAAYTAFEILRETYPSIGIGAFTSAQYLAERRPRDYYTG